MTPTSHLDPFDRRLNARLVQLAEPRLPVYIEEVLAMTAHTPQRRGWLLGDRALPVSRALTLAATLATLATLLALTALLLLGPGRSLPITPQPRASATPAQTVGPVRSTLRASPVPVAGSVPTALRGSWVGRHRDLTSFGINGGAALLELGPSTAGFLGDWETTSLASDVVSVAGSEASGEMTLTTSAAPGVPTGGCTVGSQGSYTWTLSDPRHLAMRASSEQCPARRRGFEGAWELSKCADPGRAYCLGPIEAGTWFTGLFEPIDPAQHPELSPGGVEAAFRGITYTVSAGWTASRDNRERYTLEATTPPGCTDRYAACEWYGIYTWAGPTLDMGNCRGAPDLTFDPRPRVSFGHDLVARIRTLPGVVATNVQEGLAIGGMTGTSVDLQLASGYTATCRTGVTPALSILTDHRNDISGLYQVNLAAGARMRLIVLDDPTAGFTLAVEISDLNGDRFDQLLNQAMPIVRSFDVRPTGNP